MQAYSLRSLVVKALVLIALAFRPISLQAATVHFGPDAEPFTWELVAATPERLIVHFRLHALDISDIAIANDKYGVVHLKGAGLLDQRGWPELPQLNRQLALPWGAKPRLEILKQSSQRINLGPLVPAKGQIDRSQDPKQVPYSFASIYQKASHGLFPKEVATLTPVFSLREVQGSTLKITPIQFDAESGMTIISTDILLAIHTPLAAHSQILAPQNASNQSFASIYRHQFPAQGEQLRSLIAANNPQQSVVEGHVLIIAAPELSAPLAAFSAWKRQLGFSVEVRTTNETGRNAAEIKNYIATTYQHNPRLAYVILVGDAHDVPFYPGTAGNAEGMEADPMYGLLVGNDSYPEVIIGRLSAQNQVELTNIVSRSISYERQPEVGGDWYKQASNIASDEGEPTDAARAEMLRTTLLGGTYKKIDQLYDPNVGATQIMQALNEGRSLVNYIGHGYETGWVTGGFTNANIDQLTNSQRLPLIVSVACVNGAFSYPDDDAFAERWLKAGTATAPVGAIAIFASSTNQSWVPPTIGQAAIVSELSRNAPSTVGATLIKGAIAVLADGSDTAEQTFQSWHIFGDPTLRLRTTAPLPIQAELSPRLAGEPFQLIAKESELVVTAIAGQELIASGRTNSTGVFSFVVPANISQAHAVLITVSGPNRIPLEIQARLEE